MCHKPILLGRSITRKTPLASLNVRGLLTRTKDGSDTYRVRNVAKFLHSARIDVMGVQEPHIATEDQLRLVQKALGRFKYEMHCALTTGKGGVAVMYHMHWDLTSHIQIDERLLGVIFSDPGGIQFSFLVGHLQHGASERDAQWKKLQTHFHSFDQTQLFVLANFNSVILPSRDSTVPNDHKSKGTV